MRARRRARPRPPSPSRSAIRPGIGPEVIAKCWDNRGRFGLPPFVAIGDPRSDRRGVGRPDRDHRRPARGDAAFDVGLPLIQLVSAARPTRPGTRQRRRRALLARLARARRRPHPLRRRVGGVVTGPSPRSSSTRSASAIPARPSSSPSAAASRRECRDDARRADAAHRAGHHPHAAARSVPRKLTTSARSNRAAARHPRPAAQFGIAEPRLAVAGSTPCRRRRRARAARRSRSSRPPSSAARGRLATSPAPPRRHHVPRPRAAPATTRRLCMYHDQALIPLEGAALRRRRQHHARPADRPHLARPRHRLRHRRPGPRPIPAR
jgi:4-hydroxythreonine-4-phosphate dehydrogenase